MRNKMADKKNTELTELTTPASTDVFAIEDLSATETKKITYSNIESNLSLTASQVSDLDTAISANADVTANTAKVSYNTTDSTKVGFITVTQDVDLDAMESDIALNTAKVTNATHTGEVTGSTTLTISNNVVDEANMKISNSPVNDYVLTADSAATGGWKWAAVSAGDMLAATYDPTNISGDAFDMDNMVEGSSSKILSSAERTAISTNSAKVSYPGSANATELNILDGATLTTTELNYVDGVTSAIQTQLNAKQATITNSDDITEGSTNLFLTSTERSNISDNTTKAHTQDTDTKISEGTSYVDFSEFGGLYDIHFAIDSTVQMDLVDGALRPYADNDMSLGIETRRWSDLFAYDADFEGTVTLLNGTSVNEFSTDGTLAGDSDDAVPTEKAVKTYVDANAGGAGDEILVTKDCW